MKKFLTKIVLFSIISVVLTTLTLPVATADNETATLNKLQNDLTSFLEGTPCIDEKGKDNGYVITIVEEPLSFEEEGKPGDEYQSRICVRNYISFGGETATELLKKCSSSIQNPNFGNLDVKYSCQTVQVLLSKGGTSLIEGYIGTFYRWAAGIVGIIAVVVIILSGIQISAAGGDSQAVENAKSRIIKSLVGIVVLFLSGLILYTVNPTFFVK